MLLEALLLFVVAVILIYGVSLVIGMFGLPENANRLVLLIIGVIFLILILGVFGVHLPLT